MTKRRRTNTVGANSVRPFVGFLPHIAGDQWSPLQRPNFVCANTPININLPIYPNCAENGVGERKNRVKEPRKNSKKLLQNGVRCDIIFQIKNRA